MSMNESQFGTMDEPGDAYFVDLTVYGDENIAGNVVIGGNLSVTGTSELILTETLMGDLIMGDATTKGGNIQVYRDTSGNLGFNYQPGTSLALADLLSMAADYKIQFRDAAIHVESADDGHLDLTADVSIDLNGAIVGSSTLSLAGAETISYAGTIKTIAYPLVLKNTANAADMDGTGVGIAFYGMYYDAVTPGGVCLAQIQAYTPNDMTSTASTQDGALRFWVGYDGSMINMLTIGGAIPQISTGYNMVITGGAVVTITNNSAVKTVGSSIYLKNSENAADMDGTGNSIVWQNRYYDASPAYVDSGRIAVATETDWTATASTQDSYMAFYTTLDGTCAEKVRITSKGRLYFGSGTALDTYLSRENVGVLSANGWLRALFMYPLPGEASDYGFAVIQTGDSAERLKITKDGKISWGDGTNAPDTSLSRGGANIITTDDSLYVTSTIRGGDLKTLPSSASVKTNYDHLTIQNMPQAIDMDGTEASIAWTQRYYDQTTPAYVTAGRIGVFTESDWTSVASTQDASMRFSVAIDGVVTEVARLTSGGQLQLPNTGTTTAGILIGGDVGIYRNGANVLRVLAPTAFQISSTIQMMGVAQHTITGTPKSNFDFISIQQQGNAADMDGTESSILFKQYYYDASTPAYVDAARITFGTETDWTSDAATQDGYLKFSVVVNGTVTEMMRIASTGNISAAVGGFINDYDSGDYNADWSGYTPPSGINGLCVVAHNTNGAGSDRAYFYSGGAWKYAALS